MVPRTRTGIQLEETKGEEVLGGSKEERREEGSQDIAKGSVSCQGL